MSSDYNANGRLAGKGSPEKYVDNIKFRATLREQGRALSTSGPGFPVSEQHMCPPQTKADDTKTVASSTSSESRQILVDSDRDVSSDSSRKQIDYDVRSKREDMAVMTAPETKDMPEISLSNYQHSDDSDNAVNNMTDTDSTEGSEAVGRVIGMMTLRQNINIETDLIDQRMDDTGTRSDKATEEGGVTSKEMDKVTEEGGVTSKEMDKETEEGGVTSKEMDKATEEGGVTSKEMDKKKGRGVTGKDIVKETKDGVTDKMGNKDTGSSVNEKEIDKDTGGSVTDRDKGMSEVNRDTEGLGTSNAEGNQIKWKNMSVLLLMLLLPGANATLLKKPGQELSQACLALMESYHNDCPTVGHHNFDRRYEELNLTCCADYPGKDLHCQKDYYFPNGSQYSMIACIRTVLVPEDWLGRIEDYGTEEPVFRLRKYNGPELLAARPSWMETFSYVTTERMAEKSQCDGTGQEILETNGSKICTCQVGFNVSSGCSDGVITHECHCEEMKCPPGYEPWRSAVEPNATSMEMSDEIHYVQFDCKPLPSSSPPPAPIVTTDPPHSDGTDHTAVTTDSGGENPSHNNESSDTQGWTDGAYISIGVLAVAIIGLVIRYVWKWNRWGKTCGYQAVRRIHTV